MEPLLEKDVATNPLEQFEHWYQQVLASDLAEPSAVTLATSSLKGNPSARVVLLKEYSEEGFIFFTNYNSRKGAELFQNPKAALLFYWDSFHRQIRIEGMVSKVDPEISDKYFDSRPKGSRIGAIASAQSEKVDRSVLEATVSKLHETFASQNHVPRPENWGGIRLIPNYFEFWQGQEDRLHDRIIYERNENGWDIGRLSP